MIKWTVKVFKTEDEACGELNKIIGHFRHEQKLKKFQNLKQQSLDPFFNRTN